MRKSPFDTHPDRRSLRIYALDPMLSRGGDLRVTVDIPYRSIKRSDRSFSDDRLEVVDYDGATRRFYRAIDLDSADIAMQDGVEPSEADPQFHQQMVYAVASRTLEIFDRALGRRLRFWGGHPLRLIPHAFQGRNAYYDPKLNAVLFGYFPADEDDPGANLPGQAVFTALSADIVTHEVSHAALDRLHRHYREPTSLEVPALHEAFADIVALFQRFSYTDVVRDVIRRTRGHLLDEANPLLDIGAQFGAAAGLGRALRSVGDPPDAGAFARAREPHALGRILVAAVFDGFFRTYQRRTAGLMQIAQGAGGHLRDGDLPPDLVDRLTAECAKTAQAVLTICIRGTDYLTLDPSLSDYLRAMVTADYELFSADEIGLRASMIEAFRIRGIRPKGVGSLAVESLLLDRVDSKPDPVLAGIVRDLVMIGALEMSRHTAPAPSEAPALELIERRLAQPAQNIAPEAADAASDVDEPDPVWRELAARLGRWAQAWVAGQGAAIGLDPTLKTQVAGLHPVHRTAATGELVVEMVAQLVQSRPAPVDLGGLRYRAGVTMIATLDGRIRYLIAKPFHQDRLDAMAKWIAAFDEECGPAWPVGPRAKRRLVDAFSARALAAARWR